MGPACLLVVSLPILVLSILNGTFVSKVSSPGEMPCLIDFRVHPHGWMSL